MNLPYPEEYDYLGEGSFSEEEWYDGNLEGFIDYLSDDGETSREEVIGKLLESLKRIVKGKSTWR